MRSLNRKQRPAPTPVDPEAVSKGLRTYAADLEAGDTFALEGLSSKGESPVTAQDWAAWPTNPVRLARIAYFGKPGPGDIPPADFDRLLAELAGRDGQAAA